MNSKTLALIESALMVALATVLSWIKVWEMPLGGSVTLLSMLPVMLVSIRHDIKWGLGAAFVYSLTQVLTGEVFSWGLTPTILVAALLLDYVLAFSVLGLAGAFRDKGTAGVISGVTVCCVLRFIVHFISGIVLWTNFDKFIVFGQSWVNRPVLYSLCYNGLYMLPETVFTLIGTAVLLSIPRVKKLLLGRG